MGLHALEVETIIALAAVSCKVNLVLVVAEGFFLAVSAYKVGLLAV